MHSLRPVQPPQHPSDTQAGQFSVSVDVSIEVLAYSMSLPLWDKAWWEWQLVHSARLDVPEYTQESHM